MAYNPIKSGNWNDPTVWNMGSVPGSDVDDNRVYFLTGSYTVTVSSDVIHNDQLYIKSGGILVDGAKFRVPYIYAAYTDVSFSGFVKVENGGNFETTHTNFSSTLGQYFSLELKDYSRANLLLADFSGNNYINAGTSTGGDLILKIGNDNEGSYTVHITGSPTFRLLDIRSANSAAHTVNFDVGALVTMSKFIGIGSSASNKLTIQPTGAPTSGPGANFFFESNGSSYGQFLDMGGRVFVDSAAYVPFYVGSNSTASYGLWLTQDPPKISTLVDPLTTAPGSNVNWTVSSYVSTSTLGHGGAGYLIGGDDTEEGYVAMISNDTFDIVDSSIVIETINLNGGNGAVGIDGEVVAANVFFEGSPEYAYLIHTIGYSNFQYETVATEPDISNYQRISLSSSDRILKIEKSLDGVTWLPRIESPAISVDDVALFRALRVVVTNNQSYGAYAIGSINMLPATQASGNFFAFF